MRHLALAVLLACMLSGTARAGEIPSTGAPAPPPPRSVTTTGEVPSTGVITPERPDLVLTIILTIIDIVR
jgi:hypothetical protein